MCQDCLNSIFISYQIERYDVLRRQASHFKLTIYIYNALSDYTENNLMVPFVLGMSSTMNFGDKK